MSPIMTGRSFRRHVEILDIDLPTLKCAAKGWGGTLNDVFVASVVRGLTLYHEQHGVAVPGFRALMPVNVRDTADREGGNHFVPARFVIPVHRDIADGVAEVRRNAEQWKHAPGLAMSDVLAAGLSALPAGVARGLWSSMLMGDDLCITNIPGPPFQAFLAGVAVEGIYAVTPPSGAAFSVSLVSTAERACVTITTDIAAVHDSPKLAGCIEDGFSEVCSARRLGLTQSTMKATIDFLTELDASFLYMESPHTPMHMGSIGIFEGGPLRDAHGCLRLDEVRSEVQSRLRSGAAPAKGRPTPTARRVRTSVGR